MSVDPLPVSGSGCLQAAWRSLPEDVVEVEVTGDIDFASAEGLEAGLLGLLRTGRPRRLEIDLANVTFVDCRGLSVLLAVQRTAAGTGCHLRVNRPQPLVRRVLELTGLLAALMPDPAGHRTIEGPSPGGTGTGRAPDPRHAGRSTPAHGRAGWG